MISRPGERCSPRIAAPGRENSSIILFGSILAWAVYDRIAVKRRTDAPAPVVATGGGYRNDFIAVVVGTLVYFVLGFWFHPWVIGVPVFGS